MLEGFFLLLLLFEFCAMSEMTGFPSDDVGGGVAVSPTPISL